MTIKEYLDRIPPMKADDGTTMRETAAEFCEIWSGDAARGFTILAMHRAGYSMEQIEAVLVELNLLLKDIPVDDAAKVWIDF